jgi:solute carrier family 8 (sodium/calcium exchanger)
MAGGYVEEFYNSEEERCMSWVLIPGIQLLSKPFLGVVYLIFLLYLFLGISIVADIFMEAIEVITSKTTQVDVVDEQGNHYKYEVPVWNPTIANLTLMALGSSAPEILLSVIETLNTLGKPAGELGPSTIVGSAAFNLLVISGVSILAVEDVKKINDLGVFTTTSIFSVFAYIWLYLCLLDNVISIGEAWLTLAFFFILCLLAYGADKYNEYREKKN